MMKNIRYQKQELPIVVILKEEVLFLEEQYMLNIQCIIK